MACRFDSQAGVIVLDIAGDSFMYLKPLVVRRYEVISGNSFGVSSG